MNILLIDDEKLELDQIEYILKPYFVNHNFYKAQDVSEALKIMETTNIHLALVDIQLPGRSGLELAKILKRNEYTVVIMVTAYQSFDYAQQALRLKVDNYITKPVVKSELLEVVRPYINESNYSELVINTIDYIYENYSSKVTLSSIADVIHVNPAYLSRIFNEEVGLSFSDFLNSYRIERAKRILIENENDSIAEIAERCGFNSQHYFSSLFKKTLGMTPSKYRKKLNQ